MDNNKISIPNEISLYTYDFSNNKRTIAKSVSDKDVFTICYTYNYKVDFNKKIFIKLTSSCGWVYETNITSI